MPNDSENHAGQLVLAGNKVDVTVGADLSLAIADKAGQRIWQTSTEPGPTMLIGPRGWEDRPDFTLRLHEAGQRSVTDHREGHYCGFKIGLSDYPSTDVQLELILALDADADELLVQVGQTAGQDRVRQVEHLYCLQKPVSEGGYLVVPHGSGYLVSADCPDSLDDRGIVGGAFSMPLFGMVKDGHAIYQIVQSFWDAYAVVRHVPGEASTIDLTWLSSLGSLRYRRRCVVRFAEQATYLDMARAYRQYLQDRNELVTLDEKARDNPNINRYINGVEFRWHTQEEGRHEHVLNDIRTLQSHQMQVNFFFPKWTGITDSGWDSFLDPDADPQRWCALRDYAERARNLGCLIKMFILSGAKRDYDPEMAMVDAAGNMSDSPWFGISDHFAPGLIRQVLDRLDAYGVEIDALYYDGYCANSARKEDFSPQHRMTRRQSLENVIACFKETRKRGIMPGAELARFWSVPHCDYYFFSDWAADRLHVGEPIPLFQLIYHDCYIAHFSGGGYGRQTDWDPDRNPRLYELLLAGAPSYNWLPGPGLYGKVPVEDWSSQSNVDQLAWLQRWSTYYRAVATSQMVLHEFLTSDRSRQRIAFANGVEAEFDMTRNMFRIKGVDGFSGDWEQAPDLSV